VYLLNFTNFDNIEINKRFTNLGRGKSTLAQGKRYPKTYKSVARRRGSRIN